MSTRFDLKTEDPARFGITAVTGLHSIELHGLGHAMPHLSLGAHAAQHLASLSQGLDSAVRA